MGAVMWSLLADFDRDGTFEENLTSYVTQPGQGLQIERGLNADGFMSVSGFSVALNNADGRFTAKKSDSPYRGQMDPGVPMRVKASHDAGAGAVDYTLTTVYAQEWKRSWKSGTVPLVRLQCRDLGVYLADSEQINVTVSEGRDTDAALIAIDDLLGLGSGTRDYDDGLQDLPFHFVQAQTAMEAYMAVVKSEMGGWFYIGADGARVFENRASRLGIASPDDTWGDGTDLVPVGIEDLTEDQDFVTEVRVRTTVFAEGQADKEVFRIVSRGAHQPSDNSIALTTGQVYVREFSGAQGISAFTTPVADTDYRANASADGSGADKTSALDVTLTDLGGGRFRIRLENTDAGTIYVTKFRLRGTMVDFYNDRPEAVASLSRSDLPTGKSVSLDVPFGGDAVYQPVNWAMQNLRTYRYADTHGISLEFHADTDNAKASLLALELGQLIRYTDTTMSAAGQGGVTASASYTDDWFRVDGIKYSIPPNWAGQDFLCNVRLTPTYVFRNLDAIAFDEFDRDNATGDLGTSTNGVTWADDSVWDIVSNKAVPDNTFTRPNLDLGSGVVDQVVEVLIGNILQSTGAWVGVIARYADTNNYVRVVLKEGNTAIVADNVVSGSVADTQTASWTPTDSAELRVICQGDRIRAWVDFDLVIDLAVTGNQAAGNSKVGMLGFNANSVQYSSFYGQGL